MDIFITLTTMIDDLMVKILFVPWLGWGAELFGQTLDVTVKVSVDMINIYNHLTLSKGH